MDKAARTSVWTPRQCPICETSDHLVEIGRRTFSARQRTHSFEWRQVDGVCSSCGLIQSLYAPTHEFLDDYYYDAHTTRTSTGQVVVTAGFDIEARVSPIRRLHRGGRLVEIGAGDGKFCAALRERGFDALGVDPLGGTGSDFVVTGYASQDSVRSVPASTVVAYDVMEHATDTAEWLASAAALLGPSGIVILEVPDTERWPVEAWHHEHLTQFTKESLTRLCEKVGFETVSCGIEPPSRPHGMVYVGRMSEVRTSPGQRTKGDTIEYAKRLYARAEQIRCHQQQAAQETADLVIAALSTDPGQSGEVIVWGANEIASGIGSALHTSHPDLSVRVVDNADSKIGVPHPGFQSPVERPSFSPNTGTTLIFVLCSRVWNDQIADQIGSMDLPSTVIIDGTNWPTD